LRDELGAAARDFVSTHYSVDTMIRDVERVLDRFVAGLPGRHH
jgi:hypothetical protein